VPRSIGRPNGPYSLTRTLAVRLAVGGAGSGWNIGGANYQAVSIVFDPTGANIFGSAVNFVNVPMTNAAELAALWDRVRIDKVDITFAPLFDKADGIATGLNTNPQIVVCNDYNDGAAGTSVGNILQHSDCKHFVTNESFKWSVKPKFQRLLYYTPLLSSYEPASGFVNSDTAIPHYATHFAIVNTANIGPNTALEITMKYHLTMCNVK